MSELKAEVHWALLCESVTIDNADRASINTIMNGLAVPAFPFTQNRMALFGKISGIPGTEIELSVFVTPPQGKRSTIGILKQTFRRANGWISIGLNNFTFASPGKHVFELALPHDHPYAVVLDLFQMMPEQSARLS